MVDILDFDEDGSAENNVHFVLRDKLHISIDNPWAGCTESGFGAVTSITLTRAQAVKLRDALWNWLEP